MYLGCVEPHSTQVDLNQKKPRIWAPLIFSVTVVALLTVMICQRFSAHVVDAEVSEQITLDLDVDKHASGKECQIQVRLPEGVQFYSETFPEIQGMRNYDFPCSVDGRRQSHVPVTVRGTQPGAREIHVSFVGTQNQEYSRAVFKLRLRNKAHLSVGS